MHSATYRATDGALASSELRVLGREYVFRDAERTDDAPVMAIRFSLITVIGMTGRTTAALVRDGA